MFIWIRAVSLRSHLAVALALGAVLAMRPTAAHAAKADADTPLILLGSQEVQTPRELKRGDAIVTSRLVYASLAVADEDIVGIDGKVVGGGAKVLARKGAQLFQVVARGGAGKTFCAIDHKETGALEGVFVRNADKHACFIDADGDGRFDYSYDLRTKFSPLIPLYYDVETKGNALNRPAGYSLIDAERCQLSMWLDIYVKSISKAGRSVTIGMRMRTDEVSTPFVLSKRIDLASGSQGFELLGSRILLSSKGQSSNSATVTRNIERQNFTTDRPDVRYSVLII